jgi:sulfide:quinone oxidoreductase
MTLTQLSDQVSVCGQITAADVAEFAAQGFGTVICNRPDGESFDQTPWAEIEAACKEHGLAAHYIPMSPAGLTGTEIPAFADVLKGAEGKVLAYCRTGNRSSILWQQAVNIA